MARSTCCARSSASTTFVAKAEVQEDRAPIHVYVKSLEVMGKVAAVQRRLGLAPAPVGTLPLRPINVNDVQASVQGIVDAISTVKAQMAIDAEAEPVRRDGPKTLSVAHYNLTNASLLLDGLQGRAIDSDDVFASAALLLREINLITTKLRVPMATTAPSVASAGPVDIVDVARQALRGAYQAISLQAALEMTPSAVPTLTLVRVTPTECYDLLGTLHARAGADQVASGHQRRGRAAAVVARQQPGPT